MDKALNFYSIVHYVFCIQTRYVLYIKELPLKNLVNLAIFQVFVSDHRTIDCKVYLFCLIQCCSFSLVVEY